MKVGIVTSSLGSTDGWGRYSLEVVKHLRDYAQIKVLCHKAEAVAGIEIRQVLPLPTSSLSLLKHVYKVAKELRDCDVIHCFVEPYSPMIALANRNLERPFIISGVGTYAVAPLDSLVQGIALRYAYRKADKILCISRFTEQEILKRVPLRNTCVVNLGVDYSRFQNAAVKQQETASKEMILSVGAIKPRKGFDVSIKAFAQIKKDFPNAEYCIVGEVQSQQYYRSLLELVSSLNLSNDVHFRGSVPEEELIGLYGMAHVFILTPKNIDKHFEGFGLVYLEANAAGIPVIGTLGCGAEDAIISGYNGLLVPQDDPDATAEAIKHLLNNPHILKQMGENAKQRAKEASWDNVVKQLLKIYEEAIRRRKGE